MIRFLPVALLAFLGCTASQAQAQTGDYTPIEEPITAPFSTPDDTPSQMADTEPPPPAEMDKDALRRLIEESTPTQSPPAPSSDPNITIHTAGELWAMNDRQCMKVLKKHDIRTHAPSFPTPFVRTPLLLDSPVEGIEVMAKWPKKEQGSVMDCRLVAALIEPCRYARTRGATRIEFYSTWRPLSKPEGKCRAGKKGRKCRNRKKAWDRAQKGTFQSQHNRALAIDIRWFTLDDGTVVDVLTDYERHFKQPPCEDAPTTKAGIFLKEFACHLHATRGFNVVLTPNADKDHDNHFHVDITPNATWYIIR